MTSPIHGVFKYIRTAPGMGTISKGMKDLGTVLNAIPFIAVQLGDEGKLNTRDGHGNTADTGYTFIDSGSILFKVSRRYKLVGDFLKDLENLHATYPFARLDEHHCGDTDCSMEGSKNLCVAPFDLIHPERFSEVKDWCNKNMEKIPESYGGFLDWYDKNIRYERSNRKARNNNKKWEQLLIEIMSPKWKEIWQVPIEIGEKRIADYQRVWSDCKDIAIKHYRLAKGRGYEMDDPVIMLSPNRDGLRKLLEKQE